MSHDLDVTLLREEEYKKRLLELVSRITTGINTAKTTLIDPKDYGFTGPKDLFNFVQIDVSHINDLCSAVMTTAANGDTQSMQDFVELLVGQVVKIGFTVGVSVANKEKAN